MDLILDLAASRSPYLPFVFFGLFLPAALGIWGALIALRLGAKLSLRLVGRAIYKIKQAIRRRRLVKALPPPLTKREKIEAAKAEIEAAEKAEAARLEEEGRKLEADAGTLRITGGSAGGNGNGGAVTITGGPIPGPSPNAYMPFSPTFKSFGTFKAFDPTCREVMRIDNDGATFTTASKTEIRFEDKDNQELTGPGISGLSILGALNTLALRVREAEEEAENQALTLKHLTSTVAEITPVKATNYDGSSASASLGGLAGRPRKEPIWHRQTVTPGDGLLRFFNGSQNQPGHSSNLYGTGGLPPGHHFYLYNMSVRLDGVGCVREREILGQAKLSFRTGTTIVATYQFGAVLDKRSDGQDMTVMGRPVEISAMENFWVELEMPYGVERLREPVGVTVLLNGICLKAIS